MRNVLKSSSEVFHFWANKVQSSGRAGNVSFDGTRLFSWAACIARHLPDGSVAVSTRNWSSSTRDHQYGALRAIPKGVKVIRVYEVSPHAETVIQIAKGLCDELIEKASTARTKRDQYLSEALSIAVNANDFAVATGSSERIDVEALTGKDLATIKLEVAARKQREAEVEKRHQKDAADRLAATLYAWRQGSDYVNSWMLRGIAVALRLNGDLVETTQGANIPVADARTLWPLIQRCRNGDKAFKPGQPVGDYRLTQIRQDGSLVVGCHDIAYAEVERIAAQLGLINQPELEAA